MHQKLGMLPLTKGSCQPTMPVKFCWPPMEWVGNAVTHSVRKGFFALLPALREDTRLSKDSIISTANALRKNLVPSQAPQQAETIKIFLGSCLPGMFYTPEPWFKCLPASSRTYFQLPVFLLFLRAWCSTSSLHCVQEDTVCSVISLFFSTAVHSAECVRLGCFNVLCCTCLRTFLATSLSSTARSWPQVWTVWHTSEQYTPGHYGIFEAMADQLLYQDVHSKLKKKGDGYLNEDSWTLASLRRGNLQM